MTESVKHTLIAARKLIEKPENWLQGMMAANGDGVWVPPSAPMAVKFCALGAIQRIAGEFRAGPVNDAVRLAAKTTSLALFNNTHSHAEVLAAFDRAIEAAS